MAEFSSQAEKVPAQIPHPVVPKIKVIAKKLWGIVKMTQYVIIFYNALFFKIPCCCLQWGLLACSCFKCFHTNWQLEHIRYYYSLIGKAASLLA